jgi:hypothetical protein
MTKEDEINAQRRSMAGELSATVAEWDAQRSQLDPLIRQLEAAKNDDEFVAILERAKIGAAGFDALDRITDIEHLLDEYRHR